MQTRSDGPANVLSAKRPDDTAQVLAALAPLLFEATADAVIVIDDEGVIAIVNAAAEAMFGHGRADICGKPLEILLPERFRAGHRTFVSGFRDNAEPARMMTNRPELVGLRRNGEEFPVAASISRLRRGERTFLAAIVRDITHRIAREQALEQARRDAEAASAAKSRFVAHMSHELRTPLNGILGMAQMLENVLADRGHRDMVQAIHEAGDTLLAIVNDLLDLAKISAGGMTLESAPFLPADLARKLQNAFSSKAETKGLSFSVTLKGAMQEPRLGDELRILQILFNLVGNAVKFTDEGEVRVTISARRGQPVILEVADTGVGIAPEAVDRLFEEFEQVRDAGRRQHEGTGLGLAIVKGLVEQMEGRITVQTAPGQGTTFRVQLPLSVCAERPAESHTSVDLSVETRRLKGLRALVADDSRANRSVMSAFLDRLGIRHDLAVNGRDAVTRALENSYDVFLFDIQMPQLDGFEALEEIKRRMDQDGRHPPPAIAATASLLPESCAEYEGRGFAGHIGKPLRLEDLARTLLQCLDALERRSV